MILSIFILIEANKYIWWLLRYLILQSWMGACRTIVTMSWDIGKHKMQVCWTQQNEYTFAVHKGGVWSLSGEEELVQQLWKVEDLKWKMQGKALQWFPRQAADLRELSDLSVAAAHLPVCIYHNF